MRVLFWGTAAVVFLAHRGGPWVRLGEARPDGPKVIRPRLHRGGASYERDLSDAHRRTRVCRRPPLVSSWGRA